MGFGLLHHDGALGLADDDQSLVAELVQRLLQRHHGAAYVYVELVNAVVNTYEIPDRVDPRKIASAGLWFKTAGLKLVVRPVRSAV